MHYEAHCGGLIKVIWHDGQGACLFTKKLERGRGLPPWGDPVGMLVHAWPAGYRWR